MRLALTVVTPAAGQRADVILDADPATPVAEVAAELTGLTGLTAGVSGPGADGYGQVLAFPGPRPATAGLAASPSGSPGSFGPASTGWAADPGSTTAPPRTRLPAAPPVFV